MMIAAMTTPAGEPTPEELRAYHAGSLPLARFEEVDHWLADLSPELQAQHLAPDEGHPSSPSLVGVAAPDEAKAWFLGERQPSRYQQRERIGVGGMGVVDTVHDAILDRDLALKRCRPRDLQEGVHAYAVRLRSFRREAAITAHLEHPAIVPIHDIGIGPYGEPAFLMKRLDGHPLTEVIQQRRQGSHLDLADLIQMLVRVSEAVAYAHDRSIVHRDLKPDNIIVGTLGAVYVIDWGLATSSGGTPPTAAVLTQPSGLTSFAVGTPEWMAPEQTAGAPSDPRMDVFALGGILMAVLTGDGPRSRTLVASQQSKLSTVDLTPLNRPGTPPGLAAVARRCLAQDPAERYADGAAVAAELRRWLSAGVTFAEHPTLARTMVLRLRRSPRLITALVVAVVAVMVAAGWDVLHQLGHHDEVHARIERVLARVAMDDIGSVRDALHEVHDLVGLGPAQDDIRAADVRLSAALEALELRSAQEVIRQRLATFASTYRMRGPWATEIADLDRTLRGLGLSLAPDHGNADAQLVRRHVLRDSILAALVQLQRALIVSTNDHPGTRTIPSVIAAATDDVSWQALARLLEHSERSAHDLHLPAGPDVELALQSSVTADCLLATYGPETRLVRYATHRLETEPGAFWPRVIAARSALHDGAMGAAESHALVALGAEPVSIWPHMLLGYVALAGQHAERVVAEADAGLAVTPENLELIFLRAAGLALEGQRTQAQTIVDASHVAGHLQYHLQHPVGHPMERSVQVLVDHGIHIPTADPALGPVVPPSP